MAMFEIADPLRCRQIDGQNMSNRRQAGRMSVSLLIAHSVHYISKEEQMQAFSKKKLQMNAIYGTLLQKLVI